MTYYKIMEPLNQRVCSKAIDFVLKSQSTKIDKIQIILSCAGGDTAPTFALCDTIRWSKKPVEITGLGEVFSAAFILLLSGHKRYITRNTSLMSHNCTWSVEDANSDRLRAYIKEQELNEKRMLVHYAERLPKMKIDHIKELLTDIDFYITPEEALEWGIVDEVVENLAL